VIQMLATCCRGALGFSESFLARCRKQDARFSDGWMGVRGDGST
jgi:hypothetical protein